MTAGLAAAVVIAIVTAVTGCGGSDESSLGSGANGNGTNGNGASGSGANGSGASGSGANGTGGPGTTGASGGTSGDGSGDSSHDGAGDDAVARAREWVAAKVPYCGGPNGGKDVICGGTCTRTGTAENKAWDAYRSDCSGLVSFAWDLPAPGHTTSDFAPFATDVSKEITVAALMPGDALNNDEHVMLFAGWKNAEMTEADIIQESDCGKVANEQTLTLSYDAGATKADVTYYGTFYAITKTTP